MRESAEWVIVLMPNAEVFLNYTAKPMHIIPQSIGIR